MGAPILRGWMKSAKSKSKMIRRLCSRARLAVAEPPEEFGQGGAFAVHENADAVEAGGEPDDDPDAEDHEGEGDGDLAPGIWRGQHADAGDHDERRGGRKKRGGDDPLRVG